MVGRLMSSLTQDLSIELARGPRFELTVESSGRCALLRADDQVHYVFDAHRSAQVGSRAPVPEHDNAVRKRHDMRNRMADERDSGAGHCDAADKPQYRFGFSNPESGSWLVHEHDL